LNHAEVESIFACPLDVFHAKSKYFDGKGFLFSPYDYISANDLSKQRTADENSFLTTTLFASKPVNYNPYYIWGMTAYFCILISNTCPDLDSSKELHSYTKYYKERMISLAKDFHKNKL